MKKYLFLLFLLSGVYGYAQSPKQEFRSVWFQTVYGAAGGADFPTTKISQTGNETQIQRQKNELTDALDRLKSHNFNAISFQARSRSDAMYKSSYEPWSGDLVSVRGLDPGYDPLEFVVEEAHKRGLECHVWINPYRYESSSTGSGRFESLPNDYRVSNPDWILDNGKQSILNPGMPEVRERIVAIIKEIIENYDVDGIMFDDYFYLTGIDDSHTQQQYNTQGLSVGDWRRQNINKMVEEVYNMIQEIKPYVRFGIGPAGIWGGDAASQTKYGVNNPPGISTGYAFNDIYCDPVGWLYEGTVDYITPQIYWATSRYGAANTAYNILCPWWSDVANKFGKHVYISQNASEMISNQWPYEDELKRQVEIARTSNHDNASGQVYFKYKTFSSAYPGKDETIIGYYKNNIFTQPALTPAINWKEYIEKSAPTNIRIEGTNLVWESDEVLRRYTIYAIPNEVSGVTGNFASSEYLLGVCYGNRFDLSEMTALIDTHKFGVASLDNYGNEFSPGLMDYNIVANEAAILTGPEQNKAVMNPTLFSWNPVEGVEYYVLEVSKKEDFSEVFYRIDLTETQFVSSAIPMEIGITYYWRVRTRKIGVADAISKANSVTLREMEILSPVSGETGVIQTPTITWEEAGEGFTYILQLSSGSTFTDVIEFENIETTSFEVPAGHLLASYSYYVRVKGIQADYETTWSPAVRFYTVNAEPEIPEIISPTEGEEVTSPFMVKWIENPFAHEFYLQLSPNSNFAADSRRIVKTIPAFEYETEIDSDKLEANTVYYVRLRAHYNSSRTAYSPVVSFVHLLGTGIDDAYYNAYELASPTLLNSDYVSITFFVPRNEKVQLYMCDMTGKKIVDLYSGEAFSGENHAMLNAGLFGKGIYILVMETSSGVRKTLKLVK